MYEKILFCGTPEFAATHLKALILEFPNSKIGVISRPDAPKGRGQVETVSPVKQVALDKGLSVWTPTDKASLTQQVTDFNPELIIVVAYGMIFPKALTDRYICINVHGSLLPAYRGASPIQAALLNNDPETGVTLIQMNEKMDEGPILALEKLTIEENDNFQTLHDRLAQCGSKLLIHLLKKPSLFEQKQVQDYSKATICRKLSKADSLLNPDDSLLTKWGKIRAFSPTPGAAWIQNNKRIKILSAKLENNQLIPVVVKPEGKGQMSYTDYKLGHGELTC